MAHLVQGWGFRVWGSPEICSVVPYSGSCRGSLSRFKTQGLPKGNGNCKSDSRDLGVYKGMMQNQRK